MKKDKPFLVVLKLFENTEAYFEDRTTLQSRSLLLYQIIIITLLTFLYGMVMGSYHSILQSIVAGLKLTGLFFGTFIVCFPSIFIIQRVLGSKLGLKSMLVIVFSGLLMSSAIVVSFAPIVFFFQLTGNNYHFLQLLHVIIFLFSGFFGMKVMINALKFACEKKAIYPQIGLTVFKIWIFILAFVGIQLAWNLRPFLGDKNEGFQLFRKYEGNFYTAIIYSIQQLGSGNKNAEIQYPVKKELPEPNIKKPIDADSIKFLLED